jgi:pilus assembly protein CpaC
MHAHGSYPVPRRELVVLGLLAALALGPILALGQPAAQQRESYDIGIGQKLTLRSANGKDIKAVVVSRGDILDVAPVDPGQPTLVQITGRAIGSTRLTIVTDPPEDERNSLIINVIPDIGHVQAAVDRQFPKARVQLTGSGAGVLLVTGYADQAEDVDAITNFVQGYNLRVVNNVKVGGVQQVQLEVCVAQVNRTEARRMGFNFLTGNQQNFLGQTIGPVLDQPVITDPTVPFSAGRFGTGMLQPPTIQATSPPNNLFFGLTTANSAFFGFLEALRNEGLFKDLANPTLVTLSGRPATFLVGGDAPYGTAGSGGGLGTGIQYRPFGTRLTFIPVVLGDGRIRLEIEAEVSQVSTNLAISANNANIIAPAFNVTRLHTTVEMGAGETFALGGLLETTITATTFKTPVLGDLPFFGTAWRRLSYQEFEQEVLIIVTPRLVDPLDCSQRVTKLPGQETRTPTDFELFLEGILEAPRGPRELCPDGCYRPAHWWSGPFCDPPRDGYRGGPYGNGGCSSCGGPLGLAGGCATCSGGAVQMAPVGAPLVSRPEAMPPMAVPTDAPTITTNALAPSSSVSRAVLLTPDPTPAAPRDTAATPGRTALPLGRPVVPTGTPATIE